MVQQNKFWSSLERAGWDLVFMDEGINRGGMGLSENASANITHAERLTAKVLMVVNYWTFPLEMATST